MNRRSVVAGGVAALVASGLPDFASAAEALKVVAFAGASNWPFWACQQEGFFAKENIDVSLELTPSSVELARNMMAGKYDLALAAVHNVVAYDASPGEGDLGAPADFVWLFGLYNAMLP